MRNTTSQVVREQQHGWFVQADDEKWVNGEEERGLDSSGLDLLQKRKRFTSQDMRSLLEPSFTAVVFLIFTLEMETIRAENQ